MMRTLHGKLSVVLLVLFCGLGLLFVRLTLFTTRVYADEVSQNLNRDLASHLARYLSDKHLLPTDLKANNAVKQHAGEELHQLMTLNPDIEIYVLDAGGDIQLFSPAPGRVIAERVNLEPVQRFLAALGPLPILGDDPRNPGRGKIFSAARLPINAADPRELRGYVYIVLGGESYDSIAKSVGKSYVLRLNGWATAGALATTFLLASLLFALLTRRLRRLTDKLEAFRAHELAASQGPPPRDELHGLEEVFTRMAARIGTQVETLEQSDAHRREAVSNVSHDLRTPLASLQVYLETLLMKEGRLRPDEQREYVMAALKHSERLGKLIAALFELAKLDSREMQPNSEDFSLAELLQDVVQKQNLTAQNKGVKLEAHYAEELPFVRADIGLIERALSNLLDNALRHTPPGGQIEVSLRREPNSVLVQVQDNGEGIAPEDLPHIFDRSYRARRATPEEDEAQGAGLGLAIVRRIAELHNGSVGVESAPGRGAVFTLRLPLQTES